MIKQSVALEEHNMNTFYASENNYISIFYTLKLRFRTHPVIKQSVSLEEHNMNTFYASENNYYSIFYTLNLNLLLMKSMHIHIKKHE